MERFKIGDKAQIILSGSEYSGRIGIATYIDPKGNYVKLLFRDLTERIYSPQFGEVIKTTAEVRNE